MVILIDVDFLLWAFVNIQGLEKYVMTKLSSRVFASVPDDIEADKQLSEKIPLIQQFIRPEKSDIKLAFQNETSWLVSRWLYIIIGVLFVAWIIFPLCTRCNL